MQIHDKLSLYPDLYGKGSKCPFYGCFLLKNGLSTKMFSSDFCVPMFFLLVAVKLGAGKKI